MEMSPTPRRKRRKRGQARGEGRFFAYYVYVGRIS
jgi:hypothetical protein